MEMEGKVVKSRFKRVCLFCGSSSSKRIRYRDAAVELAQELVERKLDLVDGFGFTSCSPWWRQCSWAYVPVHDGVIAKASWDAEKQQQLAFTATTLQTEITL